MAEVRPSAKHARRAGCGTGWIEASRGLMPGSIKIIGAPFPRVAGHIEQAKAIRVKRVHGSRRGEPVFPQIRLGKGSLPDITFVPASRHEIVAPWICFLFQAAARGELPLRFGRKPKAAPAAVRPCVFPGDMDDRRVKAVRNERVRALWMTPGGSIDSYPPGSAGREDRIGNGGKMISKDERPAGSLRLRDISGAPDKFGEALIGYGISGEVEGIDGNLADGALAISGQSIGRLRSHEEGPAVEPRHVNRGPGGGAPSGILQAGLRAGMRRPLDMRPRAQSVKRVPQSLMLRHGHQLPLDGRGRFLECSEALRFPRAHLGDVEAEGCAKHRAPLAFG